MAATSITFTANNVSLMRKNGTQSNHYFPQQVKFRVSKGKFVVQAVDEKSETGLENSQKKKKFIKREEEPEQYWQTEAERSGKNPMSTVLPYVAIFGLLTPFIILGIAFANGYIKTP